MTARRLSYLIGIPGSGKSTALARATQHLAAAPATQPIKHTALIASDGSLQALELGERRPLYPGTDTLALNIQPRAIQWLHTRPHPHIVGEGDRLANLGFFGAALDAGYTLNLIWIDTPPDVAAARRATRSPKQQHASFVAGRLTKTLNLTRTLPHTRIDGSLDPDTVADRLRDVLGV